MESIDAVVSAALPNDHRLRGRMGTFGLVFTVLAFSAPLTAVAGYISFVTSFGIGAPLGFMVATALLLLFSVGFMTMTKHLPRPGAFYTYITAGLGRPAGLGGALLALYTYIALFISGYVFFGLTVNSLLAEVFGVAAHPWWVSALIGWVLISALTYFNVDVSAKVLTVLVIAATAIVLVFDIVVIANGGPEGRSATPLTFGGLTSGSIGLLLLFAVGLFAGFESTAVYREEVRSPETTIPRATYLAVLILGAFFALSAYALITADGMSQAVHIAQLDPANMFGSAVTRYLGQASRDLVAILLVTGQFACVLSGHNVIARYTHSLAIDGIFPRSLAKVHPRHASPYVAAMATAATFLILIFACALSKISDVAIYGALVGVGFYGILLLLFATTLAVLVYFRVNRTGGAAAWRTLLVPVAALLGLGACIGIASDNINLIMAGSSAVAGVLVGLTYTVFILGVMYALFLRSRGSTTYWRIGRSVD